MSMVVVNYVEYFNNKSETYFRLVTITVYILILIMLLLHMMDNMNVESREWENNNEDES